jgi:Spy/CpxP family protein refolding chaperone
MKILPIAALTLALAFGGSAALLHAQAVPSDASSDKKPAAKVTRVPRVTGVWAKMGSLTPEQKTQIANIHKQTLAEKKKLDEKEQADIMALLNDEQKVELAKINEDAAAAKRKAPTPAAEPATQPDGM